MKFSGERLLADRDLDFYTLVVSTFSVVIKVIKLHRFFLYYLFCINSIDDREDNMKDMKYISIYRWELE